MPGFATIRELEALVITGVPAFGALEAGTRNPARYFGLDDSFGTVSVGKRADLLLVEGNPLDDVSNVRKLAGVMIAGRWLSADEIRSGLEKFATPSTSN